MPALPSVPQVLRIAVRAALGEDIDVLNRLFMHYSGTAPTDSELVTFSNAVKSSFESRLLLHLIDSMFSQDVKTEDLTSSTAAVGTSTTGPVAGGGSVAPLGAGTALVVSFEIPRRYRGGHPRAYIAGVPSTNLTTEQRWDPAFTGPFLTDWEAFIADIVAAGWSGAGTLTHVNISYFEGFTNFTFPSGRTRPIPTRRVTPLVDTVSGYRINPKAASQRRRNQQSA